MPPPEATEPPVAQPYHLGEFDPIDGVVMSTWYPDWKDTWIGMVEPLLERDIPVYICESPVSESSATNDLTNAGIDPNDINWLDCSLDSVWMRDYGPFYTIDEDTSLMIGDAAYYDYAYRDDSFPEQAADWWGDSLYQIPVSMEGGNFYANGEGLCVSTSTVYQWYSISEEEADALYQERLGCDKTLWLEPLYGEGTGHVDMYFTFVDAENAIVGSYADNLDSSNAELLDRQVETLEAEGITVHRVPMLPNTDVDGDGWEDFHTVINGFFASTADEKVFLMPTYYENYPEETAEAREALVAAMPGVTVIDVPADDVITWGGAIHCVTKTVPTLSWPNPCTDPYDFNDGDCDADTASPDSGAPELSGEDSDEEKSGCGCSNAGHAGGWALFAAVLLPWFRRRW